MRSDIQPFLPARALTLPSQELPRGVASFFGGHLLRLLRQCPNLAQQLGTIQSYDLDFRTEAKPDTAMLWKTALARELNAQQRNDRNNEVQAREAFREDAACFWLVAMFDQRFHLTAERRGKILPRIAKVIVDYGPEFANYSSSKGSRWYLQYYFMFAPFFGIPKADLKSILSGEVCDQFSQSAQASNLENLRGNFKGAHDARVKGAN